MEGEDIQIKRNEDAVKPYFAIRNKLLEIMVEKLKVDRSLLNENNFSESLTGQKFNLTSTDLLYLFFKIEEEFGCFINAEDICCYEFNTIQGILDSISEAVSDGMHV